VIARRLPWIEPLWPLLPPLAARGVHAVMLHGLRGVGKKSLALDFAESLLCSAPQADGRSCGRCEECRLTAAFSHPDLRWVLPQALAERLLPQAQEEEQAAAEAAAEPGEGDGKATKASREIRVDQVRALSDFLGIAAYRGGRRVVVLAPAEAMNAIAANTLLKMLEEPPPATMFILVADALDDVLPTIRSRCVLVQVPAPAAGACLPWLAEQGVAEPAAALALASGAPLAALAEAADEAIAPETSASLYRLLERGPALSAAQVAAGIGRDPPVPACLRLMQCWAFDLLQYRARGSVRYHPQREASIRQLAATARADGLWRWAGALENAGAAREHPLNPRLVIESLLARYIDVFDDRR
jgi:DNA polymerase-3 subunit delta'